MGVSIAGLAGSAAATPLDDATAKVQAAQHAADAAAATFAAAQTRAGELDAQIQALNTQIASHRKAAGSLRAIARQRAVEAYVGRDVRIAGPFLGNGDPLDQIRRDKLLETTKARDDATAAKLAAITDDLGRQRHEVERLNADQETVVRTLAAQQAQVNAQLQSAQHALDALQQQLAQVQAAAQAAASAAGIARAASSRAGTPAVPGANGMVCPVRGLVSFTDDYGAPRHQGPHEGNDLLAARGTPDVATVSGTVNYKEGGTSGKGAYLSGDNGTLYYYFHLDAYEGGPRRVAQGEVIGYVGNTGDASGGPTHTHFEVHPGHGGPVDPYPYIRPIC